MKTLWKYLLISFVLILPSFCSASAIEKIFYMSQSKEKEGIVSLKKNADKIDIVAPQAFGVTENMKIIGKISNNLKQVIKDKNLKVMPLVVNAGFEQDVIHKLLTSPKDRKDVITGLVYIAKKNGYIGWQFDFENISYLDRDLYSSFVEETAKVLHKNKMILSVAAVSRSVDYEDTDAFKNWGGVFDYARIAKAVDFISLMTYDDPNSKGPVASLPFIKSVLSYVKDKIPPEKLSLGIPLYYWGWEKDSAKKITSSGTYSRLSNIMSKFDHVLGFDEALGGAWLTYFWENKQYQLWYQNKQSFEDRLDIIKENNFRGFSAWVLGIEDPAIWSALEKTK
jgi:spore germination protein YaaH